jgi:acyl-CoA thioesterase FadM
MHRNEIGVLRTQLRELNIEYSALVRRAADAVITARMEELRGRRRVLMARIAEAEVHMPARAYPLQATLDAVGQAA